MELRNGMLEYLISQKDTIKKVKIIKFYNFIHIQIREWKYLKTGITASESK